MKHVAIIGGGISGLATAYLLTKKRPDWNITVLEKEAQPGGHIRSYERDGYTLDWGPNGFIPMPETLELLEELDLQNDVYTASEKAKFRFLYTRSSLKPLPHHPGMFLNSELLSPMAKLSVLQDLFAKPFAQEETVHAFMKRHFGRGFADTFAQAATLGISAGEAKTLSLDALFPRLRALEKSHGSLIRGFMFQAKKGQRLSSFATGGVQKLIDTLHETLNSTSLCVHTNKAVSQVHVTDNPAFALELDQGESIRADRVVLTCPAFASAKILKSLSPGAAKLLSSIPYVDMSVFGLGFNRIDVPQLLDGFGFLLDKQEGLRSLGVVFSSSIFPIQAPEGKVFLRVLCGGERDPDFNKLSKEDALTTVLHELRITLGISEQPEFYEQFKIPKAIPQYHVGHGQKIKTIMDALSVHNGLYLSGNAYYGISLNDCIRNAYTMANTLAEAPD